MSLAAVEKTVEDAALHQPQSPLPLYRPLLPGEQFPVDALGPLLGPAAKAINDKVQAPMGICGQSVVAAACLATQGHANVVLPTGHEKPISLFFMSVAASGERKSACDTEALRPVRRREEKLRKAYVSAYATFMNEKFSWDKLREKAQRKAKTREELTAALMALGMEPLPPLSPLLTCPEPTYEGLCKLYEVGHASLGIFSSEGGLFIGGHGMSDDKKLGMAAGLSYGWDGETIRRVRSLDGAHILAGRRLAIHLMAQPDVASRMLADRVLMDQGLLSRFLLSRPESTAGTRLWRETSAAASIALQGYEDRIFDILETPLRLADNTKNELVPRPVQLSPEARDLWITFFNETELQLKIGGRMHPIAGLANKLPEHAARLATVMELVNDLDAPEVSASCMKDGITLAKYYASEALRLFALRLIDAEVLLAEKVLLWLQRNWNESFISAPDLYQNGPIEVREPKKAEEIISLLAQHFWLIPVNSPQVIKGKNRVAAWKIIKTEGQGDQ